MKTKFRYLPVIFLVILVFSLCACSAGVEVLTSYNSDTGKTTSIIYSPSYISDATKVANGIDLKVTAYNEKKVNLITHVLKSSIGALGSDDTNFTMSFVVHFRNTSDTAFNMQLESITINDAKKDLIPQSFTLQPHSTFSTKQVLGQFSQWDTTEKEVKVSIDFIIDNNKYNNFTVVLPRETLTAFKKRMHGN